MTKAIDSYHIDRINVCLSFCENTVNEYLCAHTLALFHSQLYLLFLTVYQKQRPHSVGM